MITIKNALISVSDKTDLPTLVDVLSKAGVHLYATESTQATIAKMGYACEKVENYTAFPPILHGRVKTLHPKIFGGILGRSRIPSEMEENKHHHITKFDLVCVNLYPFSQNTSPQTSLEEKLDLIDIGGVSLLRASGKNYLECVTLSDPSQYSTFVDEFTQQNGSISEEFSKKCMVQSFLHTSMYDAYIAQTFSDETIHPLFLQKNLALRYGENPHQKAGFFSLLSSAYQQPSLPLGCKKLHGKSLSYNNLIDVSQGLDLLNEYGKDLPACIILKHTNPCGAAIAHDLQTAYTKAYQCDPVSAFGGVFIFNQEITIPIAEQIHSIFVDVVCAPSYSKDALAILTKKKSIRLLEHKVYDSLPYHLRDASNGILMQDKDQEVVQQMDVVCGNPLSTKEKENLLFGMKTLKYVKSNAILLCNNRHVLGIGGGQPNRIDSCRIALSHAKERFPHEVSGSMLCSDAFFPFADSIQEASNYGVQIVVEPGGSINDQKVIEEARKQGITLVFTGQRHFLH
jgi:phosphoribosylaminoimidazolecarboxamide formyltransferase / IMP cyclohydrolase